MDLESRIKALKSRIQQMYLHLGYNSSGTRRINSTQVEEKSSVLEVDRTAEIRNDELDALRRAVTKR